MFSEEHTENLKGGDSFKREAPFKIEDYVPHKQGSRGWSIDGLIKYFDNLIKGL